MRGNAGLLAYGLSEWLPEERRSVEARAAFVYVAETLHMIRAWLAPPKRGRRVSQRRG
jgi:hypothetical protein